MVQDSGGVPLSVKGVVIGLHTKSMDVVWDVPFMSGVTMGDRYVFHNDLNIKYLMTIQVLAVSRVYCRV